MTAALENSILAKVLVAIQQMAFLRHSHSHDGFENSPETLGPASPRSGRFSAQPRNDRSTRR